MNLQQIHGQRDLQLLLLKEKDLSGEEWNKQNKKIVKQTEKKTGRNHRRFVSDLRKELNNEQIEKVKDGLTYGVLPKTYSGYQDMLPELTAKQKAEILKWLKEAREHAMDGGTSEEKHAWFGKYKGRINNYLSSEGYDLKKAGEEWEKRIREK